MIELVVARLRARFLHVIPGRVGSRAAVLRGGLSMGVASALTASALAASPAPIVLPASADTAAPRPRIGLVLSGGGARGLAHVGVLKVLEREREWMGQSPQARPRRPTW